MMDPRKGLTFGVQLNPHNGRDAVEGMFQVRPMTKSERFYAPECVKAREICNPVTGEQVAVCMADDGKGSKYYVLV